MLMQATPISAAAGSIAAPDHNVRQRTISEGRKTLLFGATVKQTRPEPNAPSTAFSFRPLRESGGSKSPKTGTVPPPGAYFAWKSHGNRQRLFISFWKSQMMVCHV